MEPLLQELLNSLDAHLGWIEKCLDRIPDDALWGRLRPGTNSIGNLCLHLAGNESHYIGHGIGGTSYRRDRPAEFNAEGGFTRQELLEKLREARETTRSVLGGLTAAEFDRPVEINHPADPTVLRVILHVTEHYALHTGQIILLARHLQEGDERILPWKH